MIRDLITGNRGRQITATLLVTLLLASTAGIAAQNHFTTADEAANRLVIAIAQRDGETLERLLGNSDSPLLSLDAIDDAEIARFFDQWARFHTLLPEGEGSRLLAVGENGWTFPIPIVRDEQGWRFDIDAGLETMRIRRIGRNELAVIQAALAYHDAQTEYATEDRDGDGILEYAQQFISSPGTHNGLYWPSTPGAAGQSPLGALFGKDLPQGAYHGYRYKILTTQGEHATGGAFDYITDGNMTGGFALIAWPAEYGESGVMSFMISRSGILYQADLGPDDDTTAPPITRYDPDPRWNTVSPQFTDLETQ